MLRVLSTIIYTFKLFPSAKCQVSSHGRNLEKHSNFFSYKINHALKIVTNWCFLPIVADLAMFWNLVLSFIMDYHEKLYKRLPSMPLSFRCMALR